jgi:5-methylcytosine-specific restriction endonuclease McrA
MATTRLVSQPVVLSRSRLNRLQERFSGPVQALCNTVGTHVCQYEFVAYTKYDWAAILRYREAGHTLAECRDRFGFCIGAWYKAIERGAIAAPPPTNSGGTRRYDWVAVQAYYDAGHTYRECRATFGFAAASWTKAVRRGALRTRARQWPIKMLLARGKSRRSIKLILFQEGILKNVCSECGISEWRNKPISIEIDHINGVKNDHRLENLRMLCPNCHSQTDTHGGKNARRLRKALQEAEAPL